MTDDFYCDEALSGRTPIRVVTETPSVLAFHHMRPFWPVHMHPHLHVSSGAPLTTGSAGADRGARA